MSNIQLDIINQLLVETYMTFQYIGIHRNGNYTTKMKNAFFVSASLGFDTVYSFGTVISLRLYYVIIHYDNID